MLPSSDGSESADRSRSLRRWGPLVAIGVIAVVVIGVLLVSGGSDDGDDDEAQSGSGSTEASGDAPADAISWTQAEDEGLDDVTWPETCDQETGQVAMPFLLAAECYAEFDGDNGGETSPGVTADSIKVVAYVAPDDDPVIAYITSAIANEDTEEQVSDTYLGYAEMFNEMYQTYGRTVEVVPMVGSGNANDEVAARADAVKAAEELGAFAVWGGPVLTSAFADELAARNVMCFNCTGGDPEFYEERAPYLFGTASNADQVGQHLVEYIDKKLAGRPAEYAGDEALQSEDRVFGYLWIDSNDSSAEQAETMEERLSEVDVDLAETISYELDPARLQEQATSVIAKLKQSGVTTVIFSGDPVAPATFTTEATAQDYFPEWVLGPQALVDTTAFSRTYDQEQWSHAFGPSPLTVKPDQTQRAHWVLYEWYFGEAPPAVDTSAVLFPQPSTFFAAVQSAGPDLTPETMQAGIFSRPPTPSYLTDASISFGNNDRWDFTDYNGVDDVTEIWWDPEATGQDEIGKEGTGMWRYVDHGKRYLPGEWGDESALFDPTDADTILAAPPPDETPPDYPAPN